MVERALVLRCQDWLARGIPLQEHILIEWRRRIEDAHGVSEEKRLKSGWVRSFLTK